MTPKQTLSVRRRAWRARAEADARAAVAHATDQTTDLTDQARACTEHTPAPDHAEPDQTGAPRRAEDLTLLPDCPEPEPQIVSTVESLHPVARPDAQTPVLDLPVPPRDALRKKELIEEVVARSGIRKRDAKPAVEAALAILGEALSEGRECNLRPMGKLKVTRIKAGGQARIVHARVRQPEEDENGPSDPLAQAAE